MSADLVPADFREDVARAVSDKSAGDLDLYGAEIHGLPWEREGLRILGKAQLGIGSYEGARVTWEALRKLEPDDPEANAQLKSERDRSASSSRVLVFTGHRVDAPDRKKPRFPAAKVDAAKEAIAGKVAEARGAGSVYGIAGGASGGDILFHEACAEAGVPTRLLLALPKEKYAAESVTPSGGDWLERFHALTRTLPTRILSQTPDLPRWLTAKEKYGFWERNNEWTLHHALAAGAQNVTLIALWDGEGQGDGPGGTAHMVQTARARGAQVRIIDVNSLPEKAGN